MIYAYCIIDSNGGIDKSIIGLKGASCRNVPYMDIGAIVSEVDAEVQGVSQEDVLEYEKTVECFMDTFSVLPVRFPTVFNKEEDVIMMLKGHYSDFKANLARLRDKVEFGIKVIWPSDTIKERIVKAFAPQPAAQSASPPVKAFIKDKFQEYKIDKEFKEEADRCIALVDGLFDKFAVEKHLEKLKTEALLLDAFYLVAKERQSDFKGAFERLKQAPPCDLKFLLSGPWPPYSFCNVIASPRREASGAKQSQM